MKRSMDILSLNCGDILVTKETVYYANCIGGGMD